MKIKRMISIAMSILTFSFASCGGSSASGQDRNADEQDITDTLEKVAGVLDEINGENSKADDGSLMTFSFVGDILPGTTYPESPKGAYLPANGGANLFDSCRDILQKSDLAFGNMEGSLSDNAAPAKRCSNPSVCYLFRVPTSMAKVLADEGFDYVNLANNHAGDFGEAGLKSAFKALDEAGIKYSGVKGLAETAILEKNGKKIGVIGFATGGKSLTVHDREANKKLIKDLSDKVDITVVSMHAGAEGPTCDRVPRKKEVFHGENRGDVYQFAHDAIDAGADIVWGHGPHVVRGMETYKDRLIMYSLGNFCTPYRINVSGKGGVAPLVEVTVDGQGRFQEGQIHSFRQVKGAGPKADANKEAAASIRKLSQQDFPQTAPSIDADGKISKK
ncbi:MAG: CapA family protein [Muribaculaceae bacterium]|nr:CapA family protein [Muribaculaceae bacterium]